MVAKLDEQVAPKVVVAADGMKIEQGTIYFAPAGEHHMVIDTWPDGHVRLLAREPVAGERPSISLLFAAAAKAVESIMLSLSSTALPLHARELQEGGAPRPFFATPCRMHFSAA